jgi:iron(III) transport system substrate-binding protein
MTSRNSWAAMGMAMLLGIGGWPGSPLAQPPSPIVEGETIGSTELVQAACAEGAVVYYTGQPASDERLITAPFSKQFPCIKVSLISEVSGRLYERIRTEVSAGRTQGDVALLTDPQVTQGLINQKVLRNWTPPEAAAYPPEAKLENWWYAAIGTPFYPIYNTQLIPADQAPKDWKDLLAPQYKGKIATASISVGGTGWLEFAFFRHVLGDDYLHAFMAQQPRLYSSYTNAAVGVARGEFPLGVVASVNDYPIRTAQGGPIQPVFPPEGVPFIPFEMMLLANAPHPHAAELFANWYLSKQGQTSLVNERGAYSLRADVVTPKGLPPRAQAKFWYPGVDFINREHDALIAEVTKLSGGN